MIQATACPASSGAREIAPDAFAGRGAITRSAAGIGVYAGAFGVSFGAVAIAAGLEPIQAVTLSAVMYTGASQFALVAILAAGGSAPAAVIAAVLLGLRNAFYGVPVTNVLAPKGLTKLWAAHFVVDESAAMAVSQTERRAGRYAFWATGATLYVFWVLGTLAGAVLGSGVDTRSFGLDAAAPAIFLALLLPQLTDGQKAVVALGAAAVSFGLISLTPAGVPTIAAAAVAIAAGLTLRPAPRPTETG
jgi:4-azaleucine resistance transporter AzlC